MWARPARTQQVRHPTHGRRGRTHSPTLSRAINRLNPVLPSPRAGWSVANRVPDSPYSSLGTARMLLHSDPGPTRGARRQPRAPGVPPLPDRSLGDWMPGSGRGRHGRRLRSRCRPRDEHGRWAPGGLEVIGAKYPTLRLRLQGRTPCGKHLEPATLIPPLPRQSFAIWLPMLMNPFAPPGAVCLHKKATLDQPWVLHEAGLANAPATCGCMAARVTGADRLA
jgi:hypothetical protein